MRRRLLGAALLVAAGAAAAVGTFLPLFWEGSHFGGVRYGVTITAWDIVPDRTVDGIADLQPGAERSPQFGVPVVLSSVLLAVASALVFLPESQRLAARYTAVAGTALMAGSVGATEAYAVWMVDRSREIEQLEYRVEVGSGMWVLGASVLVAVVGVVLLHARRVVVPRPEGAVVYRLDDVGDDDVDTPPFGIPVAEVAVAEVAVVEVAQLPDSRYERSPGAPGGTS